MRKFYCFISMGLIFGFWDFSFAQEESKLQIHGFGQIKGVNGSGPTSWLEGGDGKLFLGGNRDTEGFAQLQFGLDWEPNLFFSAHVHGVARSEIDAFQGDALGIPEAFLQANVFSQGVHHFRFRLGMFFPQTSMENTDPLWNSPYTINFSAINSWIAHEIRPVGLDFRYARELSETSAFWFAATVFGGNDASGALLFWQGWSVSDRLTTFSEVLPLPDLVSLNPDAPFGPQRDDGSKSFGDDLDGDPGYSVRVGAEVGPLFLQATWWDNRGDRYLHSGEYAWETDFVQFGFEWHPTNQWTVLGEYMKASTGMGEFDSAHAQLDAKAWYVLLSRIMGTWRFSARYEDFETEDIDRFNAPINADLNDEQGDAFTATLLWKPGQNWRLGLEWLTLDAERPGIFNDGFRVTEGGDLWTLEARYIF